MGKANQLPVLIVTLWGDGNAGTLDMAIVKNRNGPSDATASDVFRMRVDPERCKLEMMPVVHPQIVQYEGAFA